jgi:hypothetical protein
MALPAHGLRITILRYCLTVYLSARYVSRTHASTVIPLLTVAAILAPAPSYVSIVPFWPSKCTAIFS